MMLSEFIEQCLQEKGYDGLFNADLECACRLQDLCPCENPGEECEPGHYVDCPTDCDYHNSRLPKSRHFHIGKKDAERTKEKDEVVFCAGDMVRIKSVEKIRRSLHGFVGKVTRCDAHRAYSVEIKGAEYLFFPDEMEKVEITQKNVFVQNEAKLKEDKK